MILFLQGPSSRFFEHVARACVSRGADVCRIGFAPGDRLYWSVKAGPYTPFRGSAGEFRPFFEQFVSQNQVTDLVLLGDGRDQHAAAIAALRGGKWSCTPWIVEHGYLRPGLIAIETWGHGGRSGIPAAFSEQSPRGAVADTKPDRSFSSSFLRYAAMDVAYHAANVALGTLLYPRYRHYALDGPLDEWRGWIGKAFAAPRVRARTRAGTDRLERHHGRAYLVPLQLDTDFQLRDHGTGRTQPEDLRAIMRSFTVHAPEDALLVVKEHPLDNGLRRWEQRTGEIAAETGVGDRVVFLAKGYAEALFTQISGLVTINSTVGLSACLVGLPVVVLGQAIYDLPGLTHRGALDDFWSMPQGPDPAVARVFRGFIRDRYHVPGAFDGSGALVGAQNIAAHIAREPWP